MQASFSKAPESVIHLAAALIRQYHERLQGASIGFIFRDYAALKNGRAVVGEASLVPEKMKPYVNLDFLITLAEDEWHQANETQRQAYLDHELCHLTYERGRPKIVSHDVEEFNAIILRYGPYRRELMHTQAAFAQTRLPIMLAEEPTLVALDPAYFSQED